MYHSVNTTLMLIKDQSLCLCTCRDIGPILVNYSSVFWYHRSLWSIFLMQNTNSAWNRQQVGTFSRAFTWWRGHVPDVPQSSAV